MTILYPRLSNALALDRLDQIRRTARSSVPELVTFAHPKAVPVATGATRATPDDLSRHRDEVMAAVEEVPAEHQAEFDRVLGRALQRSLDISRSDAAHPETWNFLTLMVFPDLLVRRFPDLHPNRALGKRRNVLRRTWLRETILGPEAYESEQPLNEDEYVQILERTAVARIPGLAASAGRNLAGVTMAGRADQLTRPVMTRITWMTGARELSTLGPDGIEGLVRGVIGEVLAEGR
ncbi:hypothetical protein ACPCG0_03705 [Propionibacteriaceae bacterium Y1923]